MLYSNIGSNMTPSLISEGGHRIRYPMGGRVKKSYTLIIFNCKMCLAIQTLAQCVQGIKDKCVGSQLSSTYTELFLISRLAIVKVLENYLFC